MITFTFHASLTGNDRMRISIIIFDILNTPMLSLTVVDKNEK